MKKYLKLKNFLFLFLFLFIFLGSNAQAQEKRATSTKSPDLNPLGNLQVKIPGIEALAEKYPIICTDDGDKETCKIPWIAVYIYAIYNYLLGIGGFLAAIALMIGGVIWLISAGNASRVSEAKSWIVGSITGIIILLTSYVLLYEINPELVNTRYVDLQTIDPMYPPDFSDSSNNPTYVDSAGLNPYKAGCKKPYVEGKIDPICQDFCNRNVMPEGMVMIDNKYKARVNVVDEEDNLKYMINPDIYERYKNAINCINPNKVVYKISNSWRSACRQIAFKIPNNKYKVNPKDAATPCCSNHGGGLAIDLSLNVENTAHIKCFRDNGLIRNADVPKGYEKWHFSRTGY